MRSQKSVKSGGSRDSHSKSKLSKKSKQSNLDFTVSSRVNEQVVYGDMGNYSENRDQD